MTHRPAIDTAKTPRSAAALLFVFGYLLTIIDIPNLPLGTFKLKVAYAFFPLISLALLRAGQPVDKKLSMVSAVFLASLLPSLVVSHNPIGSIAFYAGAVITVFVMLAFEHLAFSLGSVRLTRLLMAFWRWSIAVASVLYVAGVHERARLTFYEPSYFAIALIPYVTVVIMRLYTCRRWPRLDLAMLALAVATTESASLVLWILLCAALVWWKMSRHKLRSALVCCAGGLLIFVALVAFNDRARQTYDVMTGDNDVAALLINIGGNRLQRVWVTYDVASNFPLFGVGMNAMTTYAGDTLDSADYTFDGQTAGDFDLTVVSKAVNTYLDIASDAGLVGLAGYLVVLIYVFTRKGRSMTFLAFQLGFSATSIALMAESSYLRAYVWAIYGVIAGLSRHELGQDAGLRATPVLQTEPPLTV